MFFKSDAPAATNTGLISSTTSSNQATSTTSTSVGVQNNGTTATVAATAPTTLTTTNSSVNTVASIPAPATSIATLKESLLGSKENKENHTVTSTPVVTSSGGTLSNSSSASSTSAMGSKVIYIPDCHFDVIFLKFDWDWIVGLIKILMASLEIVRFNWKINK